MQTIAAATFKEQCLRILDELEPEGVIVTKRGKPVAKVTPIVERTNDGDLIGAMKGLLGIRGDIMDSESEWDPGDQFGGQTESEGSSGPPARGREARP